MPWVHRKIASQGMYSILEKESCKLEIKNKLF